MFTADDALHGRELWSIDDAAPAPPHVAGRHAFYNDSAFDGGTAAPDPRDDAALAADKRALLPGEAAGFANYTGYSKGLNGVMLDVAGLPGGATVSSGDFEFRVGNDGDDPAAWPAGPAPAAVTVRRGAGVNASDRVTIVWPDGTIKRQWLRVTVKATAGTGLAQPDVFYFGNAPGESGNWATAALVNSVDEAAARNRPRGASDPAPIDFRWDYNRDGRVNRADQLVARANRTTAATALRLINVPAAAAAVTDRGCFAPAARLAAAIDRGRRGR